MNAQGELFAKELKNKNQFEKFHSENPEVYILFVRFAFEAIRSGRGRYGAKSIIERIRWHTNVETNGKDFKINNNHAPYYARLFAEEYHEHKDFFVTRELRSS